MAVDMLELPLFSHSEHSKHFAQQGQTYRFQFEEWQSLDVALILKP